MGPLAYDSALERVLAACRPGPPLRVPLELTAGQYLAEPIAARFPLPRWRAASMDGFAVRAGDVIDLVEPITLELGGSTMAGGTTPPPLSPGTAWRVATGGRLPPNADSVIRQEDVERRGDRIVIRDRRDVGRNVRPEGGDVAEGQSVLAAGTLVTAGAIATLAALGVDAPLVVRRPRVLVLSSGDELADRGHLDAILAGERIADVNTPMLATLVRAAGGVPVPAPFVPDDPKLLLATLSQATDVELILTAGAVSVGPHDHVPAVMEALGATQEFRRVRMRPGGPVTMAHLPDGRPWLALPGNPVSAWTTFVVLARPAIRAMLGDPRPGPGWRRCRVDSSIERHPTLELFARVRRTGGDSEPGVELAGPQESWRTSGLARAQGIVRVPAGAGRVEEGHALDGVLDPT